MNNTDPATTPSPISLTNPTFVRFLAINAVFIAGMAVLLFAHVDALSVWVPYIAVWWWAETKFAHGLNLGLKGWILFFAVLGLVDITVIWLAAQ